MANAKNLTIRSVSEKLAREFAAGAAIRGITQAEYLSRLLAFRVFVAAHADVPAEASYEERAKQLGHISEGLIDLDLWDHTA